MGREKICTWSIGNDSWRPDEIFPLLYPKRLNLFLQDAIDIIEHQVEQQRRKEEENVEQEALIVNDTRFCKTNGHLDRRETIECL